MILHFSYDAITYVVLKYSSIFKVFYHSRLSTRPQLERHKSYIFAKKKFQLISQVAFRIFKICNLLVFKLEVKAIVLSVDGLEGLFAVLGCVMVRSNHIGLQG